MKFMDLVKLMPIPLLHSNFMQFIKIPFMFLIQAPVGQLEVNPGQGNGYAFASGWNAASYNSHKGIGFGKCFVRIWQASITRWWVAQKTEIQF